MFRERELELKHNKRTWLVTGAAGFIGSNLVEALLKLDQKVIGLDNFSTGFKDNLDNIVSNLNDKDFKFIEGDITSFKVCREAVKDVNFVLHQAALGSIPRSINDPINTHNSNISGFLNMLTASKDASVDKFIFAGSSSTYGDHPNLPKVEDVIGNPLSPYAITKYVNELYAETFSRHYDFNSIGLRYFNVFGRRQRQNGSYAAVIPKWIISILKGERVQIYGDGKTSRDFCYIDNVIQANILSALSTDKNSQNQIYNIALNDETSLLDLYKMIVDVVHTKDPSVKILEPSYGNFRAGDVKHSRADISKAKKLLSYSPSHKIKEGIEETVSWYMENSKL